MRTTLWLALWMLTAARGLLVAAEPASTLRVATYNLNWGNHRGDQVLDAVAHSKAEVVCFQETTLQSERFLQARLKASHPYFHAAGHQGRYAAERFAFASHRPLQDVAFTPPGKGLFGFFSASCNLGPARVTLVNVHLTPMMVQAGSGIAGLMGAWSAMETKHADEMDAVCAKFDARRPTIVAGDFNSLSTFAAPDRLRKAGLIDSFAAVHDDADSHPTWFWPTRPLPLRFRIDYIFHTPHFRTVRSEIVKREGSDHYLVVSELSLVEPAPANR